MTVRHFKDPHNIGDNTDRVQILQVRLFRIRRSLTDHAYHLLLAGGTLYETQRFGTPYGHGHGNARKRAHVPQQQQRNLIAQLVSPL
ncbi:hypothetical protein Barb7_02881 [Bacteroidales bacterium Barb7]|nr:hypothetical protein Barb7_02881 [Bacteroidales bacterium Barb7]